MRRLLVYCYFCPASSHRPGGVQQVVGPLLAQLSREHGWTIVVAHPGQCDAQDCHTCITQFVEELWPDSVDPHKLLRAAQLLSTMSSKFDVLLSIDRALPAVPTCPAVLMSNTLCYQTEVWAVLTGPWECVISPTRHYAGQLLSLRPRSAVAVVPYGFSRESIEQFSSALSVEHHAPTIVQVPHRPDPRKGQAAAIEGLSRALPASREVVLEISCLEEPRYKAFRVELESIARREKVADQVKLVSWKDGRALWQARARSCAALQVGHYEESFGLSMVESVLSGKPAVTCDQPAIREILQGCSLHIELTDPRSWFWSLDRWWNSDHKSQLDRELEAIGSVLSLERMAARYDTILRSAVK